ncbi:MAG: tetratricopeptide repeat protein [Patescibacteria group bacterium]
MPLSIKSLKTNNNITLANIFTTISRWCLRLVVFGVPLVFLTFTNDVLEINKFIFLSWLTAIGIICWLVGVVIDQRKSWRPLSLGIPVGLWVMVVGLSTIFSLDKWHSFLGSSGYYHHSFLGTAILAAMFVWIIQLADKKLIKELCWWLLGSALALVIFNMFQISGLYVFSNDVLRVTHFNAVSISLSLFATLLAVAVVISLAILMSRKNKLITYLSLLIGLGAFIMLIMYDRSIGWYALIAGLVILLFLNYRRSQPSTSWGFGLIGLLAVAVLLLLMPVGRDLVSDVSLNNSSSWSITRDTLAEKPILGSGPNTFLLDFAAHRPLEYNQSFLWDARFVKASNDWWQIIATTGIAGFLAWLFLQLMVIRLLWRRVIREQPETLTAGLVAAWFAVLVSSLLFPANITIWFIYWLLLALIVVNTTGSKVNQTEGNAKTTNTLIPMMLSLVAIGSVLLIVVSGRLWLSDYYSVKASEAIEQTEELTVVESYLQKSVNSDSHQSANRFALAQNIVYQARLGILDQSMEQSEAGALLVRAADIAETALTIEPNNPESYESLVSIYQLINEITGEPTGPRILVLQEQLVELEPDQPRHYADVGLSYLGRANSALDQTDELSEEVKASAEADLQKALTAFEKSAELRANYTTAILGIVRVQQLQGKSEEALALADQAAQQFSNDPAALYTLGTIYQALNDNNSAETVYLAALAIWPNDYTLNVVLAALYEERGDKEKAIIYYEKALELNPEVEEITQKLAELKGE